VTGPVPVVRRMSISREEFLRTLPAALGTSHFTVADDRVFVATGARSLAIEFTEEAPLQIASVVLPFARIELRFSGYNDDEIAEAVERFDLYFRRGGG
jgi:hypothetical protein